jgi:hypothetical protein
MTLGRRFAAALSVCAVAGFAACGEDAEGVPTPDDVQQQIDEGQRQLDEAQEAIEDPVGEAQEQLEQEAQEQLQGEGGEAGE